MKSGFLTFEIKLVSDIQPVHHPQDTQTVVGVEGIAREREEKELKMGVKLYSGNRSMLLLHILYGVDIIFNAFRRTFPPVCLESQNQSVGLQLAKTRSLEIKSNEKIKIYLKL